MSACERMVYCRAYGVAYGVAYHVLHLLLRELIHQHRNSRCPLLSVFLLLHRVIQLLH
jgi:hypothetical protein